MLPLDSTAKSKERSNVFVLCALCVWFTVFLTLDVFEISFFSTLQLLADLFLSARAIPRARLYVFLLYSLPRTFMGCSLALAAAQLTLSLNNIKIMSNKSDTANEMDVHYVAVAVAFSNIGIILPLLLFVFVVVVGKENSFLFRLSLIFSCSLFRLAKFFSIVFAFGRAPLSFDYWNMRKCCFQCRDEILPCCKMIKSNWSVLFWIFFCFHWTKWHFPRSPSIPLDFVRFIRLLLPSIVVSVLSFLSSYSHTLQLKLHLYATLNAQIVFLFCCSSNDWEE